MECIPLFQEEDTFTPLTKTLKEILAMESISFPEPPPLIGTSEKQNLNKFCDYHLDRGHNTNDFYQFKKQIEEVVALGNLAHLLKDIHRSNKRNGSQGRNGVKVINMMNDERNCKRSYEGEGSGLTKELTFPAIPQNSLTDEPIILEGMIEGHQVRRIYVDSGSSSKIMYEHCFKNINTNIRSRLRKCIASLIGFSSEIYHPLGVIDLRITIGQVGRNKTVLMEFAIVRCRSPYKGLIWDKNEKLGSSRLDHSLMNQVPKILGSCHNGNSKGSLWECGHWRKHRLHERTHFGGGGNLTMEQMSKIQEQTILRARDNSDRRPGKEPMLPEKERRKGSGGTSVLQFVMEH
ncbi:hypothetical protein Tco_0886998 [Tanacetum coccineum]